jgi:2-oxoisovalerate dehydrogenase E1 component beta subunit
MPEITFLEAIRQGMYEELKRDEKVVMMGEDIGHFGGPFKVSKGFLEEFGPKRIMDTPISESAFVGVAVGAALYGLRPIVEIQFIDFIACAFNQICNYAAKNRYRWGGPTPLVIRGPAGAGNRAGPFHSQMPEMWFARNAGLKVVVPGTPYDAKGLIKAAVRDPDPVIYIEHKNLYRRIKGEVPADDYIVPLGQANIVKPGNDMTLVTYGAMLHLALEAEKTLAQEGISVEIIDLRTIVPLDSKTVIESVKKTNRLLIVHEDVRMGGIAGEVGMRVMEEAFEYLDCPIVRITAQDTPVPQSPPLEDFYLPKISDILKAARKMKKY